MKLLEDRIRRDGHIGAGNVLKVDCFLNHQIDVPFISALGEEFYRLYKDAGITKILTIEASGIGIACLTAMHFGVPVLFAKKTPTNNIYGDIYTAEVYSYTNKKSQAKFITVDIKIGKILYSNFKYEFLINLKTNEITDPIKGKDPQSKS